MSHRPAVSLSKSISALTLAELPPTLSSTGKSKGRWRVLVFALALAATLAMLAFWSKLRAQADSVNPIAVVTVDAASYQPTLAAEAIAAAFGTQLATQTVAATDADPVAPGIQLPTSLGGTTVEVNGVRAPLFFVSANQINFLVPTGTTAGTAAVVITSGDGVVSQGALTVASAAPTVFTVSQSGHGAPAALVTPDGLTFDLVTNPDGSTRPVQPGEFLILFGSGVRNAAAGSVHVFIGGLDSTVTFAGAQPSFVGLDQINVQIPSSLGGRGLVDVVVTVGSVTSNTVNIELAGTSSGAAPPLVSGFNVESALAGQTITIQGNNFSTDPAQNRVRIGSMEARVTQATTDQLTVVVPFGVATDKVKVETGQGAGQSNGTLPIRTSISGIVQSTAGSALQGVTVRLSGTNRAASSNDQGLFLLSDVPNGAAVLEIDGGTVGVSPPFPSVVLKTVVSPSRDNQLSQPVSLQQANGSSTTVGGPGGSVMPGGDARAIAQQLSPASVPVTTGGVTLDIPGTVNFPDGSTSGTVTLTVLDRARLPVALPPKVFSSIIVQITPFETTFAPAANITFPNSDNLPAGALVDLYAYDTSISPSGFTKRGTAQVSSDGLTIFGSGVIDRTSIWFATVSQVQTTTVKGTVSDASGNPVRNAAAFVRGRSARTDGNGAFAISDVPVRTGDSLTVEIRHLSPTCRVLQASASASAVPNGVTDVGAIKLPAEPALVLTLSPNSLVMNTGLVATLQISATIPAPVNGYVINLSSTDPTILAVSDPSVTIPAGKLTASFTVSSLKPGKVFVGGALADNSAKIAASIMVTRPAPILTSIAPSAGPVSTQIMLNGSGFGLKPRQNLVAFEQNGQITLAPPDYTKLIVTATTSSLVAQVPPLAPGTALVSVISLDDAGVPSEASNKLTFSVTAPPQITSISPSPAPVGSEVTITGSGFSPVAAENAVLFSTTHLIVPGSTQPVYAHGKVVSATSTELRVLVPGYADSGSVIVVRNPARRLNQDAGLARLDAMGGSQSSLYLNFAVTAATNYVATASLYSLGSAYYENANSIAATATRLVAVNSSSGQVKVYDISSTFAANPVSLAALRLSGPPLGVAVSGNLALVGLAPPPPPGPLAKPNGQPALSLTDPAAQLIDLSTNLATGTLTLPVSCGSDVQVALSGTTALVAAGGTLYTFDVSNPSSPLQAGSLALGPSVNALAADGSLAIASLGDQLAVIDISSPGAPILKATVKDFTPVFTGALPFDIAASANISSIALSRNTAAASVNGVIVTLDLTAPAAPKVLGSAGLNFHAPSLTINGATLIAASEDAGVMLLDISTPNQPFTVSFFDTPHGDPGVLGVASAGNFIYTNESLGYSSVGSTVPSGAMSVIQFAGTPFQGAPLFQVFPKTPTSPGDLITIRGFNLGSKPGDLSVTVDNLPAPVIYANPTSYIPATNITEVTVQVPANWQPAGQTGSLNVQVKGASSGISLTAATGGPLKRVKSIRTVETGTEALTRIGAGPYVAVAEPHFGITIINTDTGVVSGLVSVGQLRNAAIPNQLGYARINQTDYLVVFGFNPYTHSAGLALVNVSNPAKPFVASDTSITVVSGGGGPAGEASLSSITNLAQSNGGPNTDFDDHVTVMAVSGATAYIHTDVLNVFDLSNPSAPVLKGVYKPVTQTALTSIPEHTSGVAVSGSTVALTTFEGAVHLLNAADPTNLQLIGRYTAPPPAPQMPPVSFNGTVAFLAGGVIAAASQSDGTLYFIDFSTPASPALKSQLQTRARALAVDTANSRLILAGEESNPFNSSTFSGDIIIVDLSNLAVPRILAALNTVGSGRGVAVMGANLYALADGVDSVVGLHLISADPTKFPQP